MQKTYTRDLLRLLRLDGNAKRQEQSAYRKPNDFATHWFAPVLAEI